MYVLVAVFLLVLIYLQHNDPQMFERERTQRVAGGLLAIYALLILTVVVISLYDPG
jgi:hypothetical protein